MKTHILEIASNFVALGCHMNPGKDVTDREILRMIVVTKSPEAVVNSVLHTRSLTTERNAFTFPRRTVRSANRI
jgi:hypothetical protein